MMKCVGIGLHGGRLSAAPIMRAVGSWVSTIAITLDARSSERAPRLADFDPGGNVETKMRNGCF